MRCELCGRTEGPFHRTVAVDYNLSRYALCCQCRADRPINLAEECHHLTTT